LPAPKSDIQKVVSLYQKSPTKGYDIKSIKVIYSPILQQSFKTHIQKLQQRAGNSAFSPKWKDDNESKLRQQVYSLYDNFAKPYPIESCPNVKAFPAWHGTSQQLIGSIMQAGYANLATTDSGYFGKGIYTTPHAEYAGRVYTKDGTLIFNWVISFSAYPVIDGDKPKLAGKGNYGNYDAHFVPVVPESDNPKEVSFIPPKAGSSYKYIEMVVFEAAACFPRYLVTLQPTLTKTLPPPIDKKTQINNNQNVDKGKVVPVAQKSIIKNSNQMLFKPAKSYYQRGLVHEQNQKYDEAYKYFYADAQKGDANSQYKVGLYRYKGLVGGKIDMEGAMKYFTLSAKQGNKDAISAITSLQQSQKQNPQYKK
jgi:hypothetical protein